MFTELTSGDDANAKDVGTSPCVENTKQGMPFNSNLFYIYCVT